MSNIGGGSSKSNSDVQFWGGQKQRVGSDIFGTGGVWDQIISGKPDASQERAQANGLELLKQRQAATGTINTPLATRQQADFLQQSSQMQGDDWFKKLVALMNPAGQKSDSKAWNFGI